MSGTWSVTGRSQPSNRQEPQYCPHSSADRQQSHEDSYAFSPPAPWVPAVTATKLEWGSLICHPDQRGSPVNRAGLGEASFLVLLALKRDNTASGDRPLAYDSAAGTARSPTKKLSTLQWGNLTSPLAQGERLLSPWNLESPSAGFPR